MKEELVRANSELLRKYSSGRLPDRQGLRALIEAKVGRIQRLNRLSGWDLEAFLGQAPIVGVDGSVNLFGGNYPHYVALLRALAKSSGATSGLESESELASESPPGRTAQPIPSRPVSRCISKCMVHTPLLDETRAEILSHAGRKGWKEINIADSDLRSVKLAWLEMEVAVEAIRAFSPRVVMMDGSLVRHRIATEEGWSKLVEVASAHDTLIIGVIEEIGTHDVAERLGDSLPEEARNMYDRELLFGLLEFGEALVITRPDFKKGLRTAFLRSSSDPHPIGVDIPEEQTDLLSIACDLVFSLTPRGGRGVPIWLDIVDSEARITNAMLEALIDAYLEPDLKRRLLLAKRANRIY